MLLAEWLLFLKHGESERPRRMCKIQHEQILSFGSFGGIHNVRNFFYVVGMRLRLWQFGLADVSRYILKG